MTTNNEYYKSILETLTGVQVTGHHSDNYYLKRICQEYGYSYTGTKRNGKYLKDLAEAICDTEYTANHFNNYFLHRIASELYIGTLTNNTDNYYLRIISENILPKTPTNLNISVPANLVYSDEFTLTGTLLDESDNPISGADVDLVVGSALIDTEQTDENGEVEFTYVPMSRGTHTFQLVFNGNQQYSGSTSSTITKDGSSIAKESSAITVGITDNAHLYTDGSMAITGTLKTDDNEVMADKTITLKVDGTTLRTATTGSNGVWVMSIADISLNVAHDLTFEFAGDDLYEDTTITREDIIITNPSISIAKTAGNQILSYADEVQTPNSQYCTLTATLATGNASQYDTIDFYDVSDSSNPVLLDSVALSGNTATYTYHSQGVGDMSVKAVVGEITGSLSAQTYIEDLVYGNTGETNKSSDFTLPSGVSLSYDSTNKEYVFTTSVNNSLTPFLVTDRINFSVECEMKSSNRYCGLTVSDSNEGWARMVYHDSYNLELFLSAYSRSGVSTDLSQYCKFKFEVADTYLKVQVWNSSGNLILERTDSAFNPTNKYLMIFVAKPRTVYVKNIKVKPL